MDKQKVLLEISVICNIHGCRTSDPTSFREDIYKLIEKYSTGSVNIQTTKDANTTRNRVKEGRSTKKNIRRTDI